MKDHRKIRSDPHQQETAFDSKLLSDFIYELNIARRCGLSYPPGHPRIQASIKKVMNLLAGLHEFREKITLEIARNVIGRVLNGREEQFVPLACQVMEKITQRSLA